MFRGSLWACSLQDRIGYRFKICMGVASQSGKEDGLDLVLGATRLELPLGCCE